MGWWVMTKKMIYASKPAIFFCSNFKQAQPKKKKETLRRLSVRKRWISMSVSGTLISMEGCIFPRSPYNLSTSYNSALQTTKWLCGSHYRTYKH